ncbi:MAG: hypothetical protein R3F30_13570 [Planctomycetota bacterium]
MQPPVLEPVVEQDDVELVPGAEPEAAGDAVRVLHLGEVGEAAREQPPLVVELTARLAPVAAREDPDAEPVAPQPRDEPGDERRLVGAAGGEVADRQDRDRQAPDPAQAAVEARCGARRRARTSRPGA